MEYCKDKDDSFTNLKTEYPVIVFDDTSDAALLCEPMISPLNNNEIDFKISFDESDDEDYMIIFDEKLFSCKIVFVDNLKTDSENENDKVNMRSSPSPELTIDDELSDKELKQIEADDQAIQTILLGLPEDIYAVEKKAKLFNEWERFTSNEGESIESYYHLFLKLMNDLKRNKHFPEKIASNLKFLNNLQPEWSRHVTIVHQTKDLHTADYTQLYDFLKYNQKE
nr:Gag-Pol polyprotein [Tanacetum cinerariifolium]